MTSNKRFLLLSRSDDKDLVQRLLDRVDVDHIYLHDTRNVELDFHFKDHHKVTIWPRVDTLCVEALTVEDDVQGLYDSPDLHQFLTICPLKGQFVISNNYAVNALKSYDIECAVMTIEQMVNSPLTQDRIEAANIMLVQSNEVRCDLVSLSLYLRTNKLTYNIHDPYYLLSFNERSLLSDYVPVRRFCSHRVSNKHCQVVNLSTTPSVSLVDNRIISNSTFSTIKVNSLVNDYVFTRDFIRFLVAVSHYNKRSKNIDTNSVICWNDRPYSRYLFNYMMIDKQNIIWHLSRGGIKLLSESDQKFKIATWYGKYENDLTSIRKITDDHFHLNVSNYAYDSACRSIRSVLSNKALLQSYWNVGTVEWYCYSPKISICVQSK